MNNKCKNYELDECKNELSDGYDGYCELCAEKRFDDYNESLMQGYTVTSLHEQMREAKKVK